MYTIRFNVHPQGLIQDFSLGGGGGGREGNISARQHFGNCLLVVFVFWYFDIVPNTLRIMLRLSLVHTTMSRSQDIYIYPNLQQVFKFFEN